jgi:2-succinyl-5-enolpyruvyl-6-hydroxy-3-cyclohexene-1-carboxylate synthase
MNIQLAGRILQDLAKLGVRDICICAGARNSPFVVLASQAQGARIYHFFEERSAAFFALGRIQREGRPVAVITTSGTAVAELLPATVEASYTSLPLILVTADRPQRYRGTGAPQTIDQVGIFSSYVEKSLDIVGIEGLEELKGWSLRQPLHLNVCFDEPLIDEEVPQLNLLPSSNFLSADSSHPTSPMTTMIQPLAIVSGLHESHRTSVIKNLLRWNIPVYAEGLSGLRGRAELSHLLLQGGEKSVHEAFCAGHVKSVLRIGGVPTLRFWRDLEEKFSHIDVYSVGENALTGLSRPVNHKVGFQHLETLSLSEAPSFLREVKQLDQVRYEKLTSLLKRHPHSEPSLIAELATRLHKQSVYLGNSMPIREWDLVASIEKAPQRLAGNRGVNGIDGQVSTFLGWCEARSENWAILGDLTALYDLSSLWITRALEEMPLRLVVVNNGGGHIFKNIFHNDTFLNRHDIHFENWAEMFGWKYESWKSIPASVSSLPLKTVIEILPDESQTDQFWQEYSSL